MTLGLIGKKIGMTRRFYENGQSVPVTVLHVEPGKVVDIITKEKRGYSAVLIGFGHIKNSKVTKQMKGVFAKKSLEPKKILKEFRVDKDSDLKLGSDVDLNIFKDINFVDIRSKTIGRGFAGVMKRHNFSGLRATHGVSVSHRSHGSTGQRQDPGRVFKGKKMAGHMGDKFRTVERLEIIEADLENNLLFVKGSVPGAKNAVVEINKAVKERNKRTMKDTIQAFKDDIAEGLKEKSNKKEKSAETNNQTIIDKFKKVFMVYETDNFKEVDSLLLTYKITHIYIIKSGEKDTRISKVAKNCIHCVFNCYQPHGEVYSSIAPWVIGNNGRFPVVPHMINLPINNDDTNMIKNMRNKLNIPINTENIY
jgi:large subunit ribosomal protein L3